MAATQLLLQHRYAHNLAYDWSGHRNHGHLVDVSTSDPSGGLVFSGAGGARVEVHNSSSLRDFGELRIRAVFQARPTSPKRRYNLVEGHLAFALVVNDNGSLQGTIRSPSAGWIGPLSAPGVVSMGTWHTAEFVHDGVSRGRLFLDGALVAERFDAAGPIPQLGPKGITIGHWPEDDRYTLVGELAEVDLWKDNPKQDAKQVIGDCCIDRKWLDERVRESRRRGWTAEAARDRLADFFGAARSAAAEVRGGSPARVAQLSALTSQCLSAIAAGNASALQSNLSSLDGVIRSQLSEARIEQLGHELLSSLQATPLGDRLSGSTDDSLTFLKQLASHSCMGSLIPSDPKDRKPHHHPPEKIPSRDPADPAPTDVPPSPDPVPAHESVAVPPGVDPDAPPRPQPSHQPPVGTAQNDPGDDDDLA